LSEPIEFPAAGITDGEIRLRLRSDADVPALIEACRDPEVVRWTRVPEDYDEAKAAEWAAHSQRMMSEGTGLPLVIADAEGDRFIGSIGINAIHYGERRCDVGYFLAPQARGRGAMARAIRLLARWAFDNLPVDRVEILVQPENGPSRRAAERAGFTFEGILRSHTIIKGARRDMCSYSLLRDDPETPRARPASAEARQARTQGAWRT
jgi:[ribosomal protein S5]-alanine N-acetyltransferase